MTARGGVLLKRSNFSVILPPVVAQTIKNLTKEENGRDQILRSVAGH